ncbi:Co-chaperone GroES [[Mycoplasma] cavipharyngis]
MWETISPTKNYLLVRIENDVPIFNQSLILETNNQEQLFEVGIVLKTGTNVPSSFYDANKTTTVMFKKYSGTSFQLSDNHNYKIIDYQDIIATIHFDE